MRNIILVIMLVCVASVSARGQAFQNTWENLLQLKPGHKVKVVDMKMKAWSGKLVSVSDQAIVVRMKGRKGEVTVERPNVLRVADLQTSHRRRNALIGLAAGVALGYAVTDAGEDNDRDIGVAILFAAPGAVVGALFPGPRPTLYRAQKPPPPTSDSNSPSSNAGE